MRQSDIDQEVWRCIHDIRVNGVPLKELGEIKAYHGPGAHEIEGIESAVHFETDGDPSLEMYVLHREIDHEFDVHVTRIGDQTAYEKLEQRLIPPISNVLPSHIFVKDDPFQEVYVQDMPFSSTHYSVYTAVALELKPTSILEIGVRGGYSAWAMLRAVPDATYVGIDADNGTNGGVEGYYLKATEMLRREYPKASVTVLKADTQRMACLDRHYDLIHIDGAHNHDEALHDLEMCAPYADYILLDDTVSISTVRSALIEFLGRHDYPAWRYDTWHGLVLIDTRKAAGTTAARYFPMIFNAPTMEAARSIILQESTALGLSTDERWQLETAWLVERIKFPPHALVFDLGCGIGRLSCPLVQRGHPVIGVDISATMRAKAQEYVNVAGTFGAVDPEMFVKLAECGMRGQGALSIWALQHMIPDDVARMISTLWQALEPGSMFYTLDCNYRCVPVEMLGEFSWLRDGFDVPALIEKEGFELQESEEPPERLVPKGISLFRRWMRIK